MKKSLKEVIFSLLAARNEKIPERSDIFIVGSNEKIPERGDIFIVGCEEWKNPWKEWYFHFWDVSNVTLVEVSSRNQRVTIKFLSILGPRGFTYSRSKRTNRGKNSISIRPKIQHLKIMKHVFFDVLTLQTKKLEKLIL